MSIPKERLQQLPAMGPTYKIAVIQLYPKPMQPAQNFAKAAAFIRSAAEQKADLAVLPEYCLTNWLPKDPQFATLCADWKHYLKEYQKLARDLNINIVPGTIVQTREGHEKPPPEDLEKHNADGTTVEPEVSQQDLLAQAREGNYLENVAYFIDNRGEIVGSYTKKNLWGPTERAHLTSSGRDAHTVFDTPLGKVGLLICWDLAFPEAFRELIAQGAKLVVIPTFWTLSDCSDAGLRHNPAAEAVFIDNTLTARAFENTCAVIFANAGGPPGRGYMGLSQVAVPFVGPITRLGSCAEGMTVVDLDMQILEDAESNYQVRADLASDGWHYDYRHDSTAQVVEEAQSRQQKL